MWVAYIIFHLLLRTCMLLQTFLSCFVCVWEATVPPRNLSHSSIHVSPCDSITIRQVIQGMEANIQATIIGSIYPQYMYASASKLELVAGAARCGVPSSTLNATNVWESRNLALGFPVILGYESVEAIRARYTS